MSVTGVEPIHGPNLLAHGEMRNLFYLSKAVSFLGTRWRLCRNTTRLERPAASGLGTIAELRDLQATRRMEASVLAALFRATVAVLGGYVVVWLKADVMWNFVAMALGMVAFGLFALPPLINRSGYE